MDKKLSFTGIRGILPTKRRLIQLYAALLYNAQAKGWITGRIYTGNAKALCVPGLNCYSCPGAVGACPLGALQNALASTGSRAPYYVLGILLLFGLTLGRTVCGWLCPVGMIQELLYRVPTPKVRKSRFTRAFSYLKYVILAVFVVSVPLWYALQNYPVPAFCKYICPAGTLEGAVGLLANPVNADKFSMLGLLFTRKFVIMLLIFGASVFIFRFFCRFLCPLGAIYGLFARVSLIGVRIEESKCVHCGLCTGCCKMDIRRVSDHECIQCGECMDVCPTGAISLKAGRITLKGPEIPQGDAARKARARSRVIWAAAVLVLAAALIFFNLPGEPAPEPPPLPEMDESIPVGSEVGMRAPDFTVPLYGGGTFTLAEHLGQVTVINFWATWCTPCVNELPYFNALCQNYGDQIALTALHSDLVTDDVDAYLSRYDYVIPFALDDSGVIASFGGSTMLPQTVILDQSGVIVYNQVGSVTYELLDSLVSPLLSQQ